MKRTYDKIILHCSATKEGADYHASDIATWHRKRGFRTIGYHYIIPLDGTIEEGRPLTQPGAHCQGVNHCSIGICYIGGLDRDGHPKNTLTPEQEDSLILLLTHLRTQFPNIQIYGHNELNPTKNCPSFDVQKWLIASDLSN